jgi:hypothetical protein
MKDGKMICPNCGKEVFEIVDDEYNHLGWNCLSEECQ